MYSYWNWTSVFLAKLVYLREGLVGRSLCSERLGKMNLREPTRSCWNILLPLCILLGIHLALLLFRGPQPVTRWWVAQQPCTLDIENLAELNLSDLKRSGFCSRGIFKIPSYCSEFFQNYQQNLQASSKITSKHPKVAACGFGFLHCQLEIPGFGS